MEEPYRGRVEAFALIADHLAAYAAMHEAEMRLDYPAALAAARRMMEDKTRLKTIYSHFIDERMAYEKGFTNRGRIDAFEEAIARTSGARGILVAGLPLEARFSRDPFNTGTIREWYAENFDDSAWGSRNTYYVWDQQEPPLNSAGNAYRGYGWYRMRVNIPADFAGRNVRLRIGGVINEGWLWVNGRYVGHRPHRAWWSGPNEPFETDVTTCLRPGETNVISLRVLSTDAAGGMLRRGFLYAPITE